MDNIVVMVVVGERWQSMTVIGVATAGGGMAVTIVATIIGGGMVVTTMAMVFISGMVPGFVENNVVMVVVGENNNVVMVVVGER
jgi:hypothetical protein